MQKTSAGPQMRQVVDWSAAIIAGGIAGILFLLLNMIFIPMFIGGNAWVTVELFASIIMGPEVLEPPAEFAVDIVAVGVITNIALSIIFTMFLAYVVHRWGIILSVVIGALFGLALYAINFWSFSYFFPWFFAMKNEVLLVNHVIFGAVAGGIYEALEVERYVRITKGEAS